jgi:hypothetical protein
MEDQPETVDAVAQSGRLRTVVKDMPEVRLAPGAFYLDSLLTQRRIL